MKKFLTIVCLAAFLIAGVFAAVEMAQLPRTGPTPRYLPTS